MEIRGWWNIGVLLVAAYLLTSCRNDRLDSKPNDQKKAVVSEPLAAREKRLAEVPLFRAMIPVDTGIDFRNEVSPQNRLRVSNIGAGVAAGDIDGDGRVDLFFSSQDGSNQLYRQSDSWSFENVTKEAGGFGAENENSTGASFADIDNDGDLDLYVCNQGKPDHLYVNDGRGAFFEEGYSRGLGDAGPGAMVSFADYDRDGDLDIYLVRYRLFEKLPADDEFMSFQGNRDEGAQGAVDILYENDGSGNFTDVTAESGLISAPALGLSATWWDYNGDGWPDLYVTNDYNEPDRFYHNNGDGTFVDLAAEALPLMPWFSMGSDAADINNDGLFDLIGVDMAGSTHFDEKVQMGDIKNTREFLTYAYPEQVMRNTVFLNTGTGRFLDLGFLSGMAATDWTWAVRIADFDNDGWQDAFYTNGFYFNARDSDRELAASLFGEWKKTQTAGGTGESSKQRFSDYLREKGFDDEVFERVDRTPLAQPNLAFRNRGDLTFEKVRDAWGLGEDVVSFGATVCDLDGDGDLDIVSNGLDDSIRIYQNRSSEGNVMTVKLRGTASNRFGIGAVVTARTAAGSQVRMLRASRGYQGGGHPEIHFGLGEERIVGKLVIDWPGGIRQELESLPAGFRHIITEPERGKAPPGPDPAKIPQKGPVDDGKTRFVEVPTAEPAPIVHREEVYDDFADQVLLPYQVSRLGPGLALEPVEEGPPRIWLGGGFGQVGQFVAKNRFGDWRHEIRWSPRSRMDAICEDMGGLFFDADGDDDLDLFVVSGGVEAGKGSVALRDRLYWNDGERGFVKATEDTLPDIRDSGGVVCTADIDRDGDLDLFIGGRLVPQEYPVSAISRVLRNDGGVFADATAQVFGGAENFIEGLVTSAIWSDINSDGWLDLLLIQEWGPVRVFLNREGAMSEVTATSGTADLSGWWNGISGGDVDNDGDIDFVVSNFGLNTKYQIKEGKPRKVFYADFDGDGRHDLVEAKYSGDTLLPVRGRSCSTLAMPSLGEKFPTYRKFALATLDELYTPEKLDESLSREANSLASGIFINDGTGKFTFRKLPQLAQIAPSFGVALQDFDGDGNIDLLMNQNFYPNQIETGPMNSGVGLFLKGQGNGDFIPVAPGESGFFVTEDARSLAIGDLNEDGWPDAVVGVNDGPLRMFLNRGEIKGEGRILRIKLSGMKGNRNGVGASVRLETAGGRVQVQEVYGGGGYLSQSASDLYFGVSADESIKEISVKWTDGETTRFVEGFEQSPLILKRHMAP